MDHGVAKKSSSVHFQEPASSCVWLYVPDGDAAVLTAVSPVFFHG